MIASYLNNKEEEVNVYNIRKTNTLVYLISILCVITNLSYYPTFQSLNWPRHIVISCWCLLVLYSAFGFCNEKFNNYFCVYFLFFVLFLFNCLIIYFVGNYEIIRNHFLQPVIISFLILCIASINGKKINTNGLRLIIYTYMYSVAIISYPLYWFYLRHSNIASIIYDYTYGKNEISVLLLCAAIMIGTMCDFKLKFKSLIELVSFLSIIIDIFILRCRAVYPGLMILFSYMFFFKIK